MSLFLFMPDFFVRGRSNGEDKSRHWKNLDKMLDGSPEGHFLFARNYLYPMFKNFEAYQTPLDYELELLYCLFHDEPHYTKIDRMNNVIFPRDHAKTTWGRSYHINCLVSKFKEGLLYISETENLADLTIETIYECFTNYTRYPEFVQDFGNLLINTPKTKKKQDTFDVEFNTFKHEAGKVGSNIYFTNGNWEFGLGLTQGILGLNRGGQRPSSAIIDDAQDPRKNYSEKQLGDAVAAITGTIFNGLDSKHGQMTVLGTMVCHGCLVDVLSRNSAWKTSDHRAASFLNEKGEEISLNPYRFPVPVLKQMEQAAIQNEAPNSYERFRLDYYGEIDTERHLSTSMINIIDEYDGYKYFYGQSDFGYGNYVNVSLETLERTSHNMLLDMVADEVKTERPMDLESPQHININEFIRKNSYAFNRKNFSRPVYIQIGLDPGGSKDGNDQNAIVVTAKDSESNIFILERLAENMLMFSTETKTGFVDKFYELGLKYHADKLVFEAFAAYNTMYQQTAARFEDLDKKQMKDYQNGFIQEVYTLHDKLVPFFEDRNKKVVRVYSEMKSIIETKRLFIRRDMMDIIVQLKGMSMQKKGLRDDLADAAFLSVWNIGMPPNSYENIIKKYYKPLSQSSHREDHLDRIRNGYQRELNR